MKKGVLILIFLISLFPGLGQKSHSLKSTKSQQKYYREIPSNSLNIELLGNAYTFGSLNYERIIVHKKFFYLSGRTGLGYGTKMPEFDYKVNLITIPILINGLFQVSNSFLFELGLGTTLSFSNWSAYHPTWIVMTTSHDAGSQFDPLISINTGIRIQGENGFIFRLLFTPIIKVTNNTSGSQIFYPWGGISFGYSF